jgi:hypothetical protein
MRTANLSKVKCSTSVGTVCSTLKLKTKKRVPENKFERRKSLHVKFFNSRHRTMYAFVIKPLVNKRFVLQSTVVRWVTYVHKYDLYLIFVALEETVLFLLCKGHSRYMRLVSYEDYLVEVES